MTRGRLVLAAAAVLLLISTAAIGLLPSPHAHVARFLLCYGVAFAAYLVSVRVVLHARAAVVSPVLLLAVCAVAHALLIPARPDLSTDVYRYAWEGHVILHGYNPFAVAPNDTTLAGLRNSDYPFVSHPHMPTIYPPLAQGVFALGAWLHPGVTTLKVLFSLFNLATVLVLFRLLKRRNLPAAYAAMFAWNPLVIVETAHSGHVDALVALLLVLGLDLWEGKRRVSAGVLLGAAVLSKYFAASMMPWLARRRQLLILAVIAAVVVAGYLPFAHAGGRLFYSLREYSENWRFNGPPFLALSRFLGDQMMVRRLLAGAGIAFAVAAAFRERDLARYLYLVTACMLLVSPTVYPWYMISLMPLLCLFRNRAWIAFSGLVMLSYLVWNTYNATGAWMLPSGWLALEYVPFYALLLAGVARGRETA
ncbi:MAG TPA: glycosyltransferase 87 family protein [Candidatus Krumholzibacteria bacterium]|nr:glycosyltransferase 87 family protein [Candidatus Krumholzibacteria bacterium]